MNLKRSLGKNRKGLDSDLNITPIMNIFVILIPFLLLTATFVRIAIIELSLPSAEQEESTNPPEDFGDLTLLVLSISDEGFQIRTSEKDYPRISKKFGEFDYDGLSVRLSDLKKQYPKLRDVVISPDSKIKYQIIVRVLDSCREVGFPNFSISG